jgi:hypothetical protein
MAGWGMSTKKARGLIVSTDRRKRRVARGEGWLTVPVMSGAFVEGSELRGGQVLVRLVTDLVCLEKQSAYRLGSK